MGAPIRAGWEGEGFYRYYMHYEIAHRPCWVDVVLTPKRDWLNQRVPDYVEHVNMYQGAG